MIPAPFSCKDPLEKVVLTFDFALELGSATIALAVCTVALVTGSDDTPSALLSGSAQISTTKVLQLVKDGTSGCDYDVRCKATLSDGRILVLARVLPVRTA